MSKKTTLFLAALAALGAICIYAIVRNGRNGPSIPVVPETSTTATKAGTTTTGMPTGQSTDHTWQGPFPRPLIISTSSHGVT